MMNEALNEVLSKALSTMTEWLPFMLIGLAGSMVLNKVWSLHSCLKTICRHGEINRILLEHILEELQRQNGRYRISDR